MVKRTAVVLGILALITVGAGMASAQALSLGGPAAPQSWVNGFPDCGGCLPTYCPCSLPRVPAVENDSEDLVLQDRRPLSTSWPPQRMLRRFGPVRTVPGLTALSCYLSCDSV